MVIGIGGVSTAGKTTLTALLKGYIKDKRISTICQDDYVLPTSSIPKINDRVNWEHPDSIDHSKFRQAILDDARSNDIVIAEGLMVFFDESTRKLFDKLIYIEIDFQTFKSRKSIDKRWGFEPNWYIQHIWDSFKTYGQIPENHDAEYLIIDGTIPFETNIIANYLNRK